MPNHAERIASALACGRPGCPCNRSSGNGWTIHCPAHDDSGPSLSVSDKDGKCLVHCHGGCSQEAVIGELKERGLWFEPRKPRGHTKAGSAPPPPTPSRVIRYQIKDEAGHVVAIHVRREFPNGSKTFVWEQPDGSPGLAGTAVADMPLYGSETIPGLPDGAEVIVVEGEKASNALRERNIPSVGTVCGASGAA